jgi:hypothetical protein
MKPGEAPGDAPPPVERRSGRRQKIDCPVTLHGGRLTVHGRAVNLGRQGVAVDLADVPPMEGVDPRDLAAVVRGLQRVFVGGVVVQFRVAQEVRIPAKLVRSGATGGDLGTPIVGLRLARPLADDEWSRLAVAPAETGPVRLRPVRRHTPFDVSLLDPVQGLVARGKVVAGAATLVEATFADLKVDPATLRERLGTAPRPSRIDAGPEILWVGTAVVRELRGGTASITARLELAPALPGRVLTRLETTPRGG